MTSATASVEIEPTQEHPPADVVGEPLEPQTPASAEAANEAGPKKRAPRRPPPTGADLDRIGRNAKDAFNRQYQGSVLKLPTHIRNHAVARMYRRTYSTVLRNWMIATTVLRTTLSDSKQASKVEIDLLAKIELVNKVYDEKLVQLEHLLHENPDADLAKNSISYQNSVNEEVAMIGPVSFKLRGLMVKADDLIDKAMICYTLGEIVSDEFEKIKFLVKNTLRSIDSEARKRRELALQASRESGHSRPGYKGGSSAADPATEDGGTKQAVLTD